MLDGLPGSGITLHWPAKDRGLCHPPGSQARMPLRDIIRSDLCLSAEAKFLLQMLVLALFVL